MSEQLRVRSVLRRALPCLLAALASLGTFAARAQEAGLDDPHLDLAVLCLADTQVERFVAEPAEVEPFEQTTLSWRVAVPPGCRVALSLAGQAIEAAGSMEVTPVHVANRFDLTARMLGVQGSVGSVAVAVDRDACRVFPFPEAAIETRLRDGLDTFLDDDQLESVELPQRLVRINGNGLFIEGIVLRGTGTTVTLDLGLRFTVRDGVARVRYVLFRPRVDSVLPDDLILGPIFDQAEAVRAELETRFNAAAAERVEDDEQLFDLVAVPSALEAVICPVEPLPARLTVRLRVLPAGDPGRFNLRVDGRTREAGAGNGGSTGVLDLDPGLHRVSQTAAAGTRLGDYRSFISGDCAADGRVDLEAGDVKICFVNNVRQERPDQCAEDCRDERDVCRRDPDLTPAICAALLRSCLASCN